MGMTENHFRFVQKIYTNIHIHIPNLCVKFCKNRTKAVNFTSVFINFSLVGNFIFTRATLC